MSIYDKYLDELDFVALDLETTGLFAVSSKIIEIGATKFDISGKIKDKFSFLVDPQTKIPEETIKIHNITDDMVKDQLPIDIVLPEFFNFIGDSVLLAHHAIFEVSFISYNIGALGLEFPDNIVLDTIMLSKKAFPDAPNYRLNTLASYLNIPSSTFHRALFDSEYCMGVFIESVKKLSEEKDENMTLRELSSYVKPLNFHNLTKTIREIDIPEPYYPIRDAMENQSKIHISYKGFNGEISNRDITPINFIKLKNKVYLEAYCHLRKEKRNFKLKKILTVK